MAVVSAIATGLAAVVSAVGSISAGRQQAQQYEYQAKVTEMQGELSQLSAQQQAADVQKQAARVAATQRVQGAAAGMDLSSGSLLDIMASSARTAEDERQNILRAGKMNYAAAQADASSYRSAASRSKSSGYFNAGASLLQGATSISNIGAKAGWFESGSRSAVISAPASTQIGRTNSSWATLR